MQFANEHIPLGSHDAMVLGLPTLMQKHGRVWFVDYWITIDRESGIFLVEVEQALPNDPESASQPLYALSLESNIILVRLQKRMPTSGYEHRWGLIYLGREDGSVFDRDQVLHTLKRVLIVHGYRASVVGSHQYHVAFDF